MSDWTIVVGGDGVGHLPPVGPLHWYLEQRGSGVIRVVGLLHGITGDDAPDQWTLGYTTDGSDPAEDSSDATEAMNGNGIEYLTYDLPAQADGTTVKVRLQTRRDDDGLWVYSDDSTVKSATVTFPSLPSAPPDAATWPGQLDVDAG